MSSHSRFHRFISLLLAFLLLVQLWPAPLWGARPAQAQPSFPLASTPTLTALTERGATDETTSPALTIARVQSAYVPQDTISNTLVITLTVTNNLLPTTFPTLDPSATVTEALAVFEAFDYSNDPNTLHHVVVATVFTPDAELISATSEFVQTGSEFVGDLAKLAPLSSAQVRLTVAVPPSVTAETLLDTGARAYASWRGSMVSAATTPAVLLPDSLGDWLIWTPDADLYDEPMLKASAEVGGDPSGLFESVRAMGYEAYAGSLRGTRGTLWSAAGNSIDQASLLIAMLRAGGTPARYRHGTLSQGHAQTLIASMFPTPLQTVGQVATGLPIADPVNDPDLLSLAQDHWWVEAYLPGVGWTDLDPSFPTAQVGQSFVLPEDVAMDGTDRIAELPDALRHKVTLRLKTENYHPLNVSPGGLDIGYPLSATFNTVQLTGKPISLAHLVEGSGQGGLVFVTTEVTYTPYFEIDGDQFLGDSYQEIITNFPFGTILYTGLWWEFEVMAPDGSTTTYTRTLVDRLGAAARLSGGTIPIEVSDSDAPLLDDTMLFQAHISTGSMPLSALEEQLASLAPSNDALVDALNALQAVDPEDEVALETAQKAAAATYRTWGMTTLEGLSSTYYAQADEATAFVAESTLVKSYAAAPRLVLSDVRVQSDGDVAMTLDLLHDQVVAYAYPEQNADATFGFQGLRGVVVTHVEGLALETATGQPALTTATIFREALAQPDGDLAVITADTLADLDPLPLSDEAKARITQAALAGRIIGVPTQMVVISDTTTVGWWETDPTTGFTVGVLENGLHGVLVEYNALAQFSARFAGFVGGFAGQFAGSLLGFVANVLNLINQGQPLDMKELLEQAYADLLIEVIMFIAGKIPQIEHPALKALASAGLGIVKTILQSCVAGDCIQAAPLIQSIIDSIRDTLAEVFLGIPIGDFITLGQIAGKLAAVVVLDYFAGIDPPLPGSLVGVETPTPAANLATTTVTAVGSGSQSVSGALQVQALTLDSSLGGAATYAPAATGLAVGGDGDPFGLITFAPGANFSLTDAQVWLDGLSGSLLIGGQPVVLPANVALTAFSGAITITEATAEADDMVLTGAADYFTLSITPTTSIIDPVASAVFNAVIDTSLDDTFTLTVRGPDGWRVTVDSTGQVTAAPPLGAAPGDYAISLTAQSGQFPTLSTTATHLVTVNPFNGLEAALQPDPLLTVPWGPPAPGATADSLTAKLQLPDAAYAIWITNTSTISHTFDVMVDGLAGDWVLLNGEMGSGAASLLLPAGAVARLSLVISPTLTVLPPAGTLYPFTVEVEAADDSSLSASLPGSFTVPAVAYPYMSLQPASVYVAPDAMGTIDLGLYNLGNTADGFVVANSATALDVPTRTLTVTPTAPTLHVNAGEQTTVTLTVDTAGAMPGEVYSLYSQTESGGYTLIDLALVTIVSPAAICAYDAVGVTDDVILSALLFDLGSAIDVLATDLGNLTARDAVVADLEAIILYLEPSPGRASLESVTASLAAHTDPTDIEADLAALCLALADLTLELEARAVYGATVAWTPGYAAILAGASGAYTLTVTNAGEVTTTYTVSVILPDGPTEFMVSLPAGAIQTTPYTIGSVAIGNYTLAATATAVDPLPVLVQASATAGLRVVDRFVDVMAVNATPDFVETGVSSTTLSVAVNNVAGLALPAEAQVAILAPTGGISHTQALSLTLLTGGVVSYDLGLVETSGWRRGIYTVTVDLMAGDGMLIPNGSGYGYFTVAEGLVARHAVTPALVAPGVVTVTTAVTTEVTSQAFGDEATASQPVWQPTGLRDLPEGFVETLIGEDGAPIIRRGPTPPPVVVADEAIAPAGDNVQPETAPPSNTDEEEAAPTPAGIAPTRTVIQAGGVVTRTEETDPSIIFTGSWSNLSSSVASGGTVQRSRTAGNTAVYTFQGTWLGLGFYASSSSGQMQITLDGVDQGVFDLYQRDATALAYYWSDLPDITHTVTVTVLGLNNAFASDTYVSLDYIEVWDGEPLADGLFEQDDPRVFLSTGWDVRSDGAASGGTYVRDTAATAWFPFTDDSATFQALAYSGGGVAALSVDGTFLTLIDLYHPTSITRTLSVDGLGAGLHVLQLSSYRSTMATVDAFRSPGVPPFYPPPDPAGVVRYEEDSGVLYNGVPYSQTSTSWTSVALNEASDGYYLRSETAGDVASFTFDGSWVGVGFVGGTASGQAQVFLDGVDQGVVDLYRRDTEAVSVYYSGLVSGTHTISVTVLGTQNPFSTNDRVNIDFFDVWDGTPVPDGLFEGRLSDQSRIWPSDGWEDRDDPVASEGDFLRATGDANLWFPFTGDSISYQALATTSGDQVDVYVDGGLVTAFDLYSPTTVTRTLSLDNLGAGPHVLQVAHNRGSAYVDTLQTPGIPPFYTPPTASGIVRYEENDPALRYNGVPPTVTDGSWSEISLTEASDGYYWRSETVDDVASLTFDGSWVGVGFVGGTASGQAQVFLDGVDQGVVDLYRRDTEAVSVYYSGLVSGTHTISVTVLGTQNPFSTNDRVNIDFFDVWDGTPVPDGLFEGRLSDQSRIWPSDGWEDRDDPVASEGDFLRATGDANLWFPFTGDSISYQALATTSGDQTRVYVDGVLVDRFSLYSPTTVTRTFSLEGLGDGPHVLQINQYRGSAYVDTLQTPGEAPFYTPPSFSGVVRYEEDHPALLYNGVGFDDTVSTWIDQALTRASRGYVARSETLNDTVSLTFDGSWVSIGFAVASNSGEAEIFIDGVSQGIVDTYNPTDDVRAWFYPGLTPGTHTLEIVVLDTSNPAASNTRIHLDYIDVWDGAVVPSGWYEVDRSYQDNAQVDLSSDWSIENDDSARGGFYYEDGLNAWFRFTGEVVTIRAFSDQNTASSAEFFLDGVSLGVVDLYYGWTRSPLVFHYTDLEPGPHVLHVRGLSRTALDAFETNPTVFDPGVPLVEWAETAITGPVLNTIVAGDINEDGIVELVVTSSDGFLTVFRGDGEDTGDGDPILWRTDLGGEPDGPALADLDGNPGAEIIAGSPDGLYAFHADGTLYWFRADVESTWRAISIGNVDADPEPEVVTSGSNCPCVVEPDGSAIVWRGTFNQPLVPNLADLTGDGRLDLLTGSGSTLYLYDMATLPPTLAWSHTFGNTIDGRGTPAVANVDGLQPGGDSGPEIAVVSNGAIHLLDADGTQLWQYTTGSGAPGGVSIADIDGDGEVELVASAQVSGGRLYALNADGTLLWEAPALDSTSANSVSVLDLDGDGVWEVVWNGANQGLTVFEGATGAILFNEPLINSTTRIDYPTIADVDGDDKAEILTNDDDGIFIVGWDDMWAEARPLWNQYNYAITNVNDDLSIPALEAPSWVIHNTYRTQTPFQVVLPVYDVVVTHTVPLSGAQVLTDTFTLPPTLDDNPYVWAYEQAWDELVQGNTFDVRLEGMQPAEVRRVSESTEVIYTLPSGSNRLLLPPLYVAAPHIIAITPTTQTASPGGAATYTVSLFNPGPTDDVYDLALSGLPAEWVSLASSVAIPAGATVTTSLQLELPTSASLDASLFAVTATTGSGGVDQAAATLNLVDSFDLRLTPAYRSAPAGQPASYTATLTNALPVSQTVALSVVSAATIQLPATVELPPLGVATVPLTASHTTAGALLITLNGLSQATSATAQANALLNVLGSRGVMVTVAPPVNSGGVGSLIPYTVTVANLGDAADTFDLSVDAPAGWSTELTANGTPVFSLSLPPSVLNSADLTLWVMAPAGTTPGDYPVAVTAQAPDAPSVTATGEAVATITDLGVTVDILSAARTTLDPTQSGAWQIAVTNLGSVADTFALSVVGFFGPVATLTPETVALNPGQSTEVSLTTDPIPYALPGVYDLTVQAVSQTDGQVFDVDIEPVTLTGYEAVAVLWTPDEQVTDVNVAVDYLVIVTNTGNLATDFAFTFNTVLAGAILTPSLTGLFIPAHSAATVVVEASGDAPGDYILTATATSTSSPATDSDNALLRVSQPTAITWRALEAVAPWPWLTLLILVGLGLVTWRQLRRRA